MLPLSSSAVGEAPEKRAPPPPALPCSAVYGSSRWPALDSGGLSYGLREAAKTGKKRLPSTDLASSWTSSAEAVTTDDEEESANLSGLSTSYRRS
nr:hypothetical protein Iba_chr01cCG11170 [Ipomoea batatas]